MADELDITKTGFRVITLSINVSSGLRPSAITRPAMSSAVRMPESIPLASVSSAESTRLAAILRHASDTGVASGSVSARAKRSFFTVLSGSAADDGWTGEVGLDEDGAFPFPFAVAAPAAGGVRWGWGAGLVAIASAAGG